VCLKFSIIFIKTNPAGAPTEVMLVGQFNKFELWDETTWYQRVKEDIDAEQSATDRSVFKIFHHFYKDKSCRRSDSSPVADCSASISSMPANVRWIMPVAC
jgi:hypothetical protein